MAAPYSQDLRERVLEKYDEGMTTRQIATVFNVCPAWARRVKQRRRESGETSPRRMGCPVVYKIDRTQLAELVRRYPDATLVELRELLGIACATSSICMALKELKLTFKKRRSMRRNRTDPMSSPDEMRGGHGRRTSMLAV